VNLSPHFTLDELTVSEYAVRNGIRNDPLPRALANLERLCVEILEPLRAFTGKPVVVLSGFRSQAVNKAVGGSQNSEHCDGRAADIIIPGLQTLDVCLLVVNISPVLRFNQCINEFGRWCHVSIPFGLEEPRRELLTAKKDASGKTFYLRGLV
jgi:hypothetical protein